MIPEPSLLNKSVESSILVEEDARSLVFVGPSTDFGSFLTRFLTSRLSSKLIILDNPEIISLECSLR